MSHRQHAIEFETDKPHVEYFEYGVGIPSRTVMLSRDAAKSEAFDETLPVREDPELWTRLLADDDIDATYIDEALATKRRRPDSITNDPKRNFDAEMQEIRQLCRAYPELHRKRDTREFEAHFRFGRQLFQHQDPTARWVLANTALKWPGLIDLRLLAMVACTVLPSPVWPRAYDYLERCREVVK